MFRDDYDPDLAPPPHYAESIRWWKNRHGWCKGRVRTYRDGDRQQDILEWGLTDKEYFKRKLAGNE